MPPPPTPRPALFLRLLPHAVNYVWVILATLFVTLVIQNLLTGEKKINKKVQHLYGVADPPFIRSMGSLLGPPLVPGNDVREFVNGDRIFAAMLEAIRGAQKTVTFETFIYWSGTIGREFAEALAERAKSGVHVHVLLDWLGTNKLDDDALKLMIDSGVKVEKYHPLRWYNLGRVNNRTHRKLLVIDGRIGFTGGVGIADNWSGDARNETEWRDSHYRVEGPAVAHMQAAFMDNWMKSRGEVLHGDAYFPPLEPRGGHYAQVFKSSSTEGSESVRLMYLLTIASAEKRIRIANSYFVPDDLSVDTFVQARKRGVEIEIIVPGKHIDTHVTRRASRSRWGRLLECGIAIYEFQPTMFHCKTVIVDDIWVSVGSTNFDSRSFRLNDEANLNILDREFARRQTEIFEADKKRARQITFEEWKNRPLREKVIEHAAGLIRSQL